MLIRAIRAEQMKLHRSTVWLAFVILPLLPAVMGTFNYLQNLQILENGWYSLWTQHTLFTCYFFLPALIGVYCSYLLRLEHSHHNWNMVMTAPVPAAALYWAKLLAAAAMVVLTQVWIGVLFVLSGKLAGLPGLPPAELALWLLSGILGGVVVSALQLCISLVIRSFAVPVGVALAGGVAGLAALAKGYGAWMPYALIALGMRANNPTGEMAASPTLFVVNSLVFLALFSGFALLWLTKRDVTAA